MLITTSQLFFHDNQVRQSFANHRCYYTRIEGGFKREATGVFLREQRTKEGVLGYVFKDPISNQNWLWTLSKKNGKPFALARVK
jgi:hypothetical protein